MLTNSEVQQAAARGWRLVLVVDETERVTAAVHAAGTEPFNADELGADVTRLASVKDALAIKILTAMYTYNVQASKRPKKGKK